MSEKPSITWLEKAIRDEWKNGGLTVALKCLKVSTVNKEEYTKAFVKEV
ncbi:4672_t:CDS:2 [Scutellospora calospora]|uniref:4672_t:CDS:1 n=1 Tax=Scutellospora calospora TaxID=85575 RepID=A0ACA9JU92_9GLOM|nr:4672_t:CDS:2 [Scutellospora calospora]